MCSSIDVSECTSVDQWIWKIIILIDILIHNVSSLVLTANASSGVLTSCIFRVDKDVTQSL